MLSLHRACPPLQHVYYYIVIQYYLLRPNVHQTISTIDAPLAHLAVLIFKFSDFISYDQTYVLYFNIRFGTQLFVSFFVYVHSRFYPFLISIEN